MKFGLTIEELAASMQVISARLRAVCLYKLPPTPKPQASPLAPLPGAQARLFARPVLGPWEGSKELRDWFPWRFNCAGRVVHGSNPDSRDSWVRDGWASGTTTGRMSSAPHFEEVPRPAAENKRCVKCGQTGHHSSNCPQKWLDVDLRAVELRVLANMTDAERQALLDDAPPGTHWLIEESAPVSADAWRALPSAHPCRAGCQLNSQWGQPCGLHAYCKAHGDCRVSPVRGEQSCPWDAWKAPRDV